MSDSAIHPGAVYRFLDDVLVWVEKTRAGLTREEARRIFHRYRSDKEKPAEPSPSAPGEPPPPVEEAGAPAEKQELARIVNYMETTTLRLDQIETDIGYIKEKVDTILKKL